MFRQLLYPPSEVGANIAAGAPHEQPVAHPANKKVPAMNILEKSKGVYASAGRTASLIATLENKLGILTGSLPPRPSTDTSAGVQSGDGTIGAFLEKAHIADLDNEDRLESILHFLEATIDDMEPKATLHPGKLPPMQNPPAFLRKATASEAVDAVARDLGVEQR